MTLPDFLVEVPYGAIRLTGHRIDLLHVIEPYKEGLTAEQIADEFDSIPLDLVHKVIGFYQTHQEEVDAYMARCYAILEEQYANSPKIDWMELRRRMEEKRSMESK